MTRLNWIAAVLIVLQLLGGYVGAYFACSSYSPSWIFCGFNGFEVAAQRNFPNQFCMRFFYPFVWIESQFRGDIHATYGADGDDGGDDEVF